MTGNIHSGIVSMHQRRAAIEQQVGGAGAVIGSRGPRSRTAPGAGRGGLRARKARACGQDPLRQDKKPDLWPSA